MSYAPALRTTKIHIICIGAGCSVEILMVKISSGKKNKKQIIKDMRLKNLIWQT